MKKSWMFLLFILLIPGLLPAQRVLQSAGGTSFITPSTDQVYQTMLLTIPNLSTINPTNITFTTADSGGIIKDDGGAAITVKGVCWSTNPYPTIADPHTSDGAGIAAFVSHLTGLLTLQTTMYYVRAYATNSVGTAYGNNIGFICLPNCGTVTDVDGNVYSSIIINNVCYTRENLTTTRYYDGVSIPNVTDNSAWAALTSDAYCWYQNLEGTYRVPYGALYNWYTVSTGKLCPSGWHVPSDAEWSALTDYLGAPVAANELKEAGFSHWAFGNASSNSTGFTALPGGFRSGADGSFSSNVNNFGDFWSSTAKDVNTAWQRFMFYNNAGVIRVESSKKEGYSVHCIKN